MIEHSNANFCLIGKVVCLFLLKFGALNMYCPILGFVINKFVHCLTKSPEREARRELVDFIFKRKNSRSRTLTLIYFHTGDKAC